MRRAWVLFLFPVFCAAGCAATKPCMIIPAQIELARDARDYAQQAYEGKKGELDRWQQNVEQSRSKLARLLEDREQLMKEIEPTGDESKGGGK